MSSWLSGLKDLTQEFSEKVQAAIPIDKETLQKLTLNTPDMQAERAQFHEEYKHKVAVKDSLADLYPWETRDAERDILVEECKEGIMALSADVDTFFGPYKMPQLKVNTEKEEEEKTEEEVLLAEEEGEENVEEIKEVKDKDPTSDSLEKLQKLEPLPTLLANFDLDAHVGLIQKMLKMDLKLVERQSNLSGGGEREKVFWRNYFFHCAFTRYEAGLSIDEIWSDELPTTSSSDVDVEKESVVEEEEVTFDNKNDKTTAAVAAATEAEEKLVAAEAQEELFTEEKTPTDSPASEYEIVESADGEANMDDAFDGEMDELEAEIARELEN
eukprot:CAMPEP_0119004156 /NCGR_PEP_ID=MMETSP1176-20130426/984_1 /TAXON_ID=265551 /ORGANISM="Synedropsis recta cf, Strain CCMP1620" /LENGTH=327 /DNA_ID=CAMNT_0006955833 /DNA_START=68 /DNA_END=1051 /DNA_ORIENTATION=+